MKDPNTTSEDPTAEPGVQSPVKDPAKRIEAPIPKEGTHPSVWQEWRRKYGHHFDDVDIDSFLESIYESRGRKMPDYMRTRK